LCGIVFIPLSENQSDQPEDVPEVEPEVKPKRQRRLCNYSFLVLLCMTSSFITGYYVPLLLLPGQARNPKYGVSEGVGNNLILIWGICNCIGRILLGFLGDLSHHFKHKRPYLTSFTIITFCTIVCTATMFVFPHVMIYGNASFISLQIVYGFFVAGGISLRSVILKELIPGSVATPLSWMYFSDGVFVVLGFCLSAYVDTITPTYAYTFAGICFAGAVVLMFALLSPYLKAYNAKHQEKAVEKARKKAEKEGNNDEATEMHPLQSSTLNPDGNNT